MEQLLHYVWKHRMFPLDPLATTDGQPVEVIDAGLHNRNAGPDFFNAKVKINGTLWVGNVEIHDRSSDWYRHGHDKDDAYDNVILHVVGCADCEARTRRGDTLPQLVLSVPADVSRRYEELLASDAYPPCYRIIPSLPRLTAHSWMAALETERLENKTEAIAQRARDCGGDWEKAYFITLARNFGFGINGEAFEQWARSLPLNSIAHHRDDPFQVEAFFMGQAGLLDADALPERYRSAATDDEYFKKQKNEYAFLAHKFSLTPVDHRLWRFLRLRPQNFPYIRLSQLAGLYCRGAATLSRLTECESIDKTAAVFDTAVSEYWQTHYMFGAESRKSEKRLTRSSINVLLINTAVPVLFAYGRHKSNDRLCDRAFDILDTLKAEDNNIVRMWQQVGLPVSNAGDSQALIQLKKNYCDRHDCLRCRFGFEYLKGREKKN